MIGLDAALGVHSSHHCQYIVIVCPVGAYYPEGLNPVKIYVEDEDVRAVKGGTGMAKTGGTTPPPCGPATGLRPRGIARFCGWTASIASILRRSAP